MIDAHVHLLTKSIIQEAFKDWEIDKDKIPEFVESIADFSLDVLKEAWIEALDKNGIDKVVFMGMSPRNKEFLDFINSSDKFEGFTSVDPLRGDALKNLSEDIEAGMKGLKLYPSARGFSVADKRAYPVYEYCNEKKIPILVHFGVTIGPKSDLRFGNPIDLSPVLSDFPNQKFVIAHFGAGFFRETLMITYKRENVYFDTSGTNNWLCYHPYGLDLVDVFKRALNVVGPDRIIFGTDSRLMIDEYRIEMLEQQKSILKLLLKPDEIELVMSENARRVYNL